METHLHGIRRLFLHPCHYTSVVHRQDGYVYLHDELTGVSVAKSSVSFTEDIDSLAFMDNFNSFCALSRGKHIVVFETDASKWLRHKRMQLPAGQPILATLGISYLEENSLLVCVSNTSIAYLNLQQECIQHTSKLVKGITVSNAHPNV